MSRQQIHITLAGRELAMDAGTTAADAIFLPNESGPAPSPSTVIAARVNGALRDLAAPLAEGDQVEPVEIGSEDGRAILRHSTAHVMAQAVQALFPGAKLGIGPPDDLKSIEARMRAIVKQGQRFSRRVVTDVEARAELAGEPYKLELVGLKGGAADAEESVEVGGSELTMYDNTDPRSGELRCELPLIVSNHPDLARVAQQFGIDFQLIPVTP